MPSKFAPHVAQAIGRAAPTQTAAQPKAATAAPLRPAAAPRHVAQAVAAAHHPYTQPAVMLKMAAKAAAPAPAPHMAAALRSGGVAQKQEDDGEGQKQKEAFAKLDAARGIASDYVTYPDLKTGGAPPPPPRRPVFALNCPDGSGCNLRDVRTGRQQPATDFWGGFVRMAKGGPIYLSPRFGGPGAPGDSHPSIASATPEGMAGKKSVVAAGEIGILAGSIVGHNDKTGHFQSRKNRRQSGLPSDLYHPFTEDPKEWYHS